MKKPLEIAFKDTEHSDFIEAFVRERVERLERSYPRITSCRVVIEVPHRSSESRKTPLGIAVEIEVPGRKKIVARNESERREMKNDQTATINRTFDAVERQLEAAAQTQRGDVKQHADAADTGIVVRLFPDQNYGFVELRGSPDLYFTRNAVKGDFDDLEVGTHVHVTRATTEGPMGPQASSVKPITGRSSPP